MRRAMLIPVRFIPPKHNRGRLNHNIQVDKGRHSNIHLEFEITPNSLIH